MRDTPISGSLSDLRGLRLGKCARRILLLAPLPSQTPVVLPPERVGRAAAESQRRAMRFLAARGLIELTWKTEVVTTRRQRRATGLVWDGIAGVYRNTELQDIPVQRAIERRAVKLTGSGELLVDRLRPALETGQRIRWDLVLDSISE